jgi:hypothetical protein
MTFVVVQLAAVRSASKAAPDALPALFMMLRPAYTAAGDFLF